MAASTGARLQRKAARSAVSAAATPSFLRCYGIQFTRPGAGGSAVPLIKEPIANGERFWANAFEYACARNGSSTARQHPWTSDVIDKSSLIGFAIFSCCAWVTAWRRARSEARALPRSCYSRSAFAAPVRTLFGPRGFQPETKRA